MFTLVLTSLSVSLLAHDGAARPDEAPPPQPCPQPSFASLSADALSGAAEPLTRSLGIAIGGTRLISSDPTLPALVGFVWLEGAQRWGRFELALRVPVGAGRVDSSNGAGAWMVVTGAQAAARASIDVGELRLLAGGQLSTLFVIDGGPLERRLLAGPGLHVGAERLLTGGLTLLFRSGLDWFVDLSGPQRFAIDASLSAAWRF